MTNRLITFNDLINALISHIIASCNNIDKNIVLSNWNLHSHTVFSESFLGPTSNGLTYWPPYGGWQRCPTPKLNKTFTRTLKLTAPISGTTIPSVSSDTVSNIVYQLFNLNFNTINTVISAKDICKIARLLQCFILDAICVYVSPYYGIKVVIFRNTYEAKKYDGIDHINDTKKYTNIELNNLFSAILYSNMSLTTYSCTYGAYLC